MGFFRDVNKARGRKAKAKARGHKAKAKARRHKAKAKAKTSRLKANKAKGSSIYYVTTGGGVRGLVTFSDKGVGSKMAQKSVT